MRRSGTVVGVCAECGKRKCIRCRQLAQQLRVGEPLSVAYAGGIGGGCVAAYLAQWSKTVGVQTQAQIIVETVHRHHAYAYIAIGSEVGVECIIARRRGGVLRSAYHRCRVVVVV